MEYNKFLYALLRLRGMPPPRDTLPALLAALPQCGQGRGDPGATGQYTADSRLHRQPVYGKSPSATVDRVAVRPRSPNLAAHLELRGQELAGAASLREAPLLISRVPL